MTYAKKILSSEERLRTQILRAFIDDDSLEASNTDMLISVDGSVLNDRSSQMGDSLHTSSIASMNDLEIAHPFTLPEKGMETSLQRQTSVARSDSLLESIDPRTGANSFK